jgi:hypothetical protein
MSRVVILSWDPDARMLEYVQVNSGFGGSIESHRVGEDAAEQVAGDLAGHELPQVGELVTGDDGVLVEVVPGSPVLRCGVKAVGPPQDRSFELRPMGAKRAFIKLPAGVLLVDDPSMASAVQAFDFLYSEKLSPPGCWVCAGGIDAWQRRRRAEREASVDAEAAAEAERNAAEQADRSFINPYTFVPFPGKIIRSEPAGHDRLGDGMVSGSFTVTWEFTTPFQAPKGASGTPLVLPGSSVKGAVRSVHEALAGGCLRIFDDEFIPSYRDAAGVRNEGWTLAVVAEATRDGEPLSVHVCDEVVWVRVAQLRAACGGSLATGSRVTIEPSDVPARQNKLGRKELGENAVVQAGGDWVVLVTRAGTRKPGKAFFLACGRLTTPARTAEVSDDAWRAFRVAIAGADDVRPANETAMPGDRPQERQPTTKVLFDGAEIGRRRLDTRYLWHGDVIWAQIDGLGATSAAGRAPVVRELSLARIWRHPGWDARLAARGDRVAWSAGARVPGHLRACGDPLSLCPSCQIFGSADPNARGHDDRADQRAYSGHVRFGDARSPAPVGLELISRAPMGSPRPGAGQFYLAYDDPSPAGKRDARPTREWGAEPDATKRRQLRGRKFYWHADPARQASPRHLARAHQKKSSLAKDVSIAPAGTRLTQRVSFDNLSRDALGGLLAALEPQRVLPEAGSKRLRLHLGGAKPLGLGSCFATISELRVWTAGSRYGGEAGASPDHDGYLAGFASSCPVEVTSLWPALAAVLGDDTVDAARVWYPPGAYWSDRAGDEQTFDAPFAFFTGSSGMFLENTPPRTLIRLPDPRDADQGLPIKRKDDLT